MKEKLQKDFKFLRLWYVRLIISGGLGLLIPIAINVRGDDEIITATILITALSFLALYFFYAWLYPSTDINK